MSDWGRPRGFTVREPLALGETATLAFNGTYIAVYGTVASNGSAGWNFSIDGRPSGAFIVTEQSAPGNNIPFWNSSALEDAAHTLTIVVDHDSKISNARTLFLDYFVYNTTSTAEKSVLIDDSETVVITYSPDWQACNDCDSNLQRTQHVSGADGSSVALCFEGTQISLFGTGSPLFVVIDGASVNLQSQNDPPDKQLFQSALLPQGNHTMNITVGSSTAIDYFLVTTNLTFPRVAVVRATQTSHCKNRNRFLSLLSLVVPWAASLSCSWYSSWH
ncbi:hypothetical protein K438DRAFT_2026036 [Mycena galopus ATCC 62051]|nr:hypothetical protein K438DRAFT_2026036 [Mycena galopus ATCC 62051]